MSDNYFNLSPEEKRKRDDDMYQKFIVLGIVPLFIYLMWPFIFGTNKVEEQAQIVEERIENIDEEIEASLDIDETTIVPEDKKVVPAVPAKPKRTPNNRVNKVQPGTIKKKPIQPANNQGSTLTYNQGDKIEYIVQNMGWKGIVQSKQNGNYTVKITEVITANASQQFTPGNNPCFGGKPIGKNAKNQVINVPGRCIHVKER